MKKTATVTWIKYNNYGTFLQAYALQKSIEKLGYDNDILNDRKIYTDFEKEKYSIINRMIIKLKKYIKEIILVLNFDFYSKLERKHQKRFKKFKEQHLKIYNNVKERNLYKINKKYDIFICGSDQIWTPVSKIFNPYYYLGFVLSKKNKIAYAPSIGVNNITKDYHNKIKELLKSFNYISVRENNGKEILKKMTDKDIEVVLDPTLLLEPKEWNKIIDNKIENERKYVLCYFLEGKQWYIEYAKKIAKDKKIDLKVIYIDKEKSKKYPKENMLVCGPQDFIEYIKKAYFVCTDSFHGTVFSILYSKQFVTLKRFKDENSNCQNSRLYNLLKKLEIEDRFIDEENIEKNIENKCINYELVHKKLEEERKNSIDYLKKSLRSE